MSELRKELGIDDWLELVKEDKNLDSAYTSFAQYMYLLEQENRQLKERKNKALNYIKNYNSMEFRYQDKKVIDKLDIIKNILNNRLDFEDEDIEIIRLNQQLKQSEKIIDEAIKFIDYHRDYQDVHKQIGINEFEDVTEDILFEKDVEELLEILQRHKGNTK